MWERTRCRKVLKFIIYFNTDTTYYRKFRIKKIQFTAYVILIFVQNNNKVIKFVPSKFNDDDLHLKKKKELLRTGIRDLFQLVEMSIF